MKSSYAFTNTGAGFFGIHAGDGSGLTNLNASSLASGTVATNRLPGQLANLSTGNGSGLTGIGSSVTNFTGVALTPTGTNLTINLSGYTTNNVIDLSFTLSLTTNVYVLAVTNSAPLAGKGFSVEVSQGGLFTLAYATNQAPAGAAAIIPPAFGQFVTMPTNSTASRMMLYFKVGASGTNVYLLGQSLITR